MPSENIQLQAFAPNKPTNLHPVLIKNGSPHVLSGKNTIFSSMELLGASYFETNLYKYVLERNFNFVKYPATDLVTLLQCSWKRLLLHSTGRAPGRTQFLLWEAKERAPFFLNVLHYRLGFYGRSTTNIR